jgi:site-specific DNA-cytosine methylase
MYRAVDCQGFAGGFTLGMVQAGFTLVGKREMQGGFGVANCEANRHLLGSSWKTEAVEPESWSPVAADVVFGNPPCSGFSVMSAKEFRGADSKINHCMWSFVDYAAKVRPYVAVFESVQQAFTSDTGLELMRALRARLEERTGEAYTLHHVRHNAVAVGGPSVRRRYFWLVSRIPFGINRERLPRYPVINEVIGDLANLGSTWQDQPYRSPASWWGEPRRSASGKVDGHVGVSNPLTRRVRDLLEAVEWKPGEAIGKVCRRHWDEYGRLPDSFAVNEEKIVKNEFNMGFTTPTRWPGDQYGRVITGAGLVCVIHPFLPRTVTHREVARIMGFPDDWRILPLRNVPGLQMTWGKGITVDCGRWIGRWIHDALDGVPGTDPWPMIGDREYDINLTNDYPTRVGQPDIVIESPKPRKERLMTEPEPAAEPAASGTRGRPRPGNTIDRDAAVYELIAEKGPVSRPQIAEGLGIDGGLAYLSLYRLKRDGKVVKQGNLWSVVETPTV